MTVTAAREKDAGSRLGETVWDGVSIAVKLALPGCGRAIDRWVTWSNPAACDLCDLTDRLQLAESVRNALGFSQPAGLLISFLNPKTKEKERADPEKG
jgi:hypothetical protein